MRYTLIGLVIGLILSVVAIFLHEFFDQYIRSEEYLLRTFDIPLLAVIPDLNETHHKGSYYYYKKGEGD